MKNIFKLTFVVLATAMLFVVGGKLVSNDKVEAAKPGVVITTQPYNCGSDLCQGYRCVNGTSVSPACYNSTEILTTRCDGQFMYMPDFQNSCSSTQYYYVWTSTNTKGHK